MKRINRARNLLAAITIGSALTLGAPAANAGAVMVGELIAAERVDVISGGISFPVARSTQILFDGDGVRTRADSFAPIEFPGKGSVKLGFNSEVVVAEKGGAVHLTIKKGGVQFTFNKGQAFQIQAENQVIASEATLMQKISTSAEQISGIVVIEGGKVHVIPETEGVVVISGGQANAVSSGEIFEVDLEGNQLVKTVAPNSVTYAGSPVVAVGLVAGIVLIGNQLSDENDSTPGS